MPIEREATDDIARRVRVALDTGDLEAFRELLHPDARWGPPEDATAGCQNRDQVLAWYEGARAAGMRAQVTEIVTGPGKLLVGLKVARARPAAEPGGAAQRWQILTLRDGLVVDIRGFEHRADAAAFGGLRH